MSYALRALALTAGTMVAGTAMADTVATFADPATGPNTPLFSFNSATNVLTGGWSGAGLLLQTPGVAAPDYANAQFQMTPITVVASVGPTLVMSAGQINFYDAALNPLMTATFSGGYLTPQTNFGASDFTGFNVTFSGPILNGYSVSNEAFSFSFANPAQAMTFPGWTATSSFTSSANIIPAPGAAALLGLGGLAAARRRRA